jgi:hypothetical protein
MANKDNECKNLEILDKYTESINPLADIIKTQKKLQEETYKINFKDLTISEIMDYWHTNTHALIDEIHEMTDALGGNDNNAVWKTWKAKHNKYKFMYLKDLSEDERKELIFEWIDCFHFLINYALSIGLEAHTIYNYYFSKVNENINRQKKGY